METAVAHAFEEFVRERYETMDGYFAIESRLD
jgi:hypothetical protein